MRQKPISEPKNIRVSWKETVRRRTVALGVAAIMYPGKLHLDACFDIARGSIEE